MLLLRINLIFLNILIIRNLFLDSHLIQFIKYHQYYSLFVLFDLIHSFLLQYLVDF